jgi:hypothetical protein
MHIPSMHGLSTRFKTCHKRSRGGVNFSDCEMAGPLAKKSTVEKAASPALASYTGVAAAAASIILLLLGLGQLSVLKCWQTLEREAKSCLCWQVLSASYSHYVGRSTDLSSCTSSGRQENITDRP